MFDKKIKQSKSENIITRLKIYVCRCDIVKNKQNKKTTNANKFLIAMIKHKSLVNDNFLLKLIIGEIFFDIDCLIEKFCHLIKWHNIIYINHKNSFAAAFAANVTVFENSKNFKTYFN